MKLSVIVPAYNEAATIGIMLTKLKGIKEVAEIVVVDDCSKDKTKEIIKAAESPKIKLITHPQNLGKGAAIRTGLKTVTGDYVLIQDADLEYDPLEIPALIQPLTAKKAEVVYGSRFLGPRTNMFYWHYVGNRFLNFVINVLFNTILTDMETCYKVIPTKLFRSLHLTANDFSIEPEITCKLLNRKVKIMEVPITFSGRSYAEGKKITWRDGFKALAVIFKTKWEVKYED